MRMAMLSHRYYNSDIMAKRFGNKDGTMTDTQRALMQANVQSERTQIELMLETMCNCFGACERIVRSQVCVCVCVCVCVLIYTPTCIQAYTHTWERACCPLPGVCVCVLACM